MRFDSTTSGDPLVLTLEQEGDRLAARLGVAAAKSSDVGPLLRRIQELTAGPTRFRGFFEGQFEILHPDTGEVLVSVLGPGVTRYSREGCVAVLLVWALMGPGDEELDAWAATVLICWGWRVEGSRVPRT